MEGDIGEIQLGSERELYKYIINHYAVVTKASSKIILVQTGVPGTLYYLHFFRITVVRS